MKKLIIANNTYNFVGGGVISVVTVYGMKEALNLMFQSNETLEKIKTLFSDSTKTAAIQIEDENHVITAYSEYTHLDGTITVSSEMGTNTYTIKLFKDDSVAIQNRLLEATQKIADLSQKLEVTQAALNEILVNKKDV